MRQLPPQATQASRIRYRLARDLAAQCPAELAQEIAATGSTSRGVAGARSDLEINFWTDTIPDAFHERPAWLAGQLTWLRRLDGVSDVYVDDTPIADGSVWVTFGFHGVWVEAAWQDIQTQSQLVAETLRGDVLDHERLVVADAVFHALPLCTAGALARWQQSLSVYPNGLQSRLIRTAVEGWVYPLHIIRRSLDETQQLRECIAMVAAEARADGERKPLFLRFF